MPPLLALDDWMDPELPSGEPVSAERAGFRAGTVIDGAYRVIGPLGMGAMGVVLLAHDERLDRRVAIKCTHNHLLTPGFRERFVSEARAMARVNHPNVVQVHAFGEHDGAPYFVMEYVEGPTLEQWLAAGPTPAEPTLALHILDELCRGVSAIHAADTVHHDIKPSNILLDSQLRPRVADLGLAVFFRQDSAGMQREIIGTPTYMAPEIAFSKDSDPRLRSRSDIYSLACVAYQLLTGRPPFDGLGNIGMLLQHATRPVEPPSRVRAGLPPALDAALLRALAKDPAQRTPTVEQFRLDLASAHRAERDPVRILVAEDDDDFREALRLFLGLEFPSAEIECVSDGRGALDAVDRHAPSVAILDLRMPGIDGMELTGLLRARASSAALPIIILTASGGSDDWRRLSALGADRFLLKPVVMDDLALLVRRVLGERAATAAQAVVA